MLQGHKHHDGHCSMRRTRIRQNDPAEAVEGEPAGTILAPNGMPTGLRVDRAGLWDINQAHPNRRDLGGEDYRLKPRPILVIIERVDVEVQHVEHQRRGLRCDVLSKRDHRAHVVGRDDVLRRDGRRVLSIPSSVGSKITVSSIHCSLYSLF